MKVAHVSLVACAAVQPENSYLVNMPVGNIHVLRQMRDRRSDEGIQELAESIKDAGQIHPGIVVALPEDAARTYIKRINEMWGTSYKLSQFKSVFVKEVKCEIWLFVVAGHRRLHAVKEAKLKKFYCYVHMETSFSRALQLQFQENMHEAVHGDDEARFLTLFWREEKSADPTLSLAKFAKKLGKQPEAIRRSLRFTSLPVKLQKLVQPSAQFKKGIAFGILCEIAKLQEATEAKGKQCPESQLIRWTYFAVTYHKTVKRTAQWVNSMISELEGQGAMFELSAQDAVVSASSAVAKTLETTVRAGCQQLEIVARFHASGDVDKIASVGAVNTVHNTLDLVKRTAPQIIDGLKGGRGSRRVIEEVQEVARRG